MSKRPLLNLDLQGEEGNAFLVIAATRSKLSGHILEQFNSEIGRATLIDTGTTYRDILAIVNRYVRLIDRSGLHTEYAVDREAIVSGIDHFHERLDSLPDTVSCTLIGMFPDFDDPNCDAYAYMKLLRTEIWDTELDITLVGLKDAEPLRQLLVMLQELASALRWAGVE